MEEDGKPRMGNVCKANRNWKQKRKPGNEAKIVNEGKIEAKTKGKTENILLPEQSMWDPGRSERGFVRRIGSITRKLADVFRFFVFLLLKELQVPHLNTKGEGAGGGGRCKPDGQNPMTYGMHTCTATHMAKQE